MARLAWFGAALVALSACSADDGLFGGSVTSSGSGAGGSDSSGESSSNVTGGGEGGEQGSSVSGSGGDPSTVASTTGATTGPASTAASTAMSSSAQTGGGACDPAPGDNACSACVKMSCCMQAVACGADENCTCWVDCVEDGNSQGVCYQKCGGWGSPWNNLFVCVQTYCAVKCG